MLILSSLTVLLLLLLASAVIFRRYGRATNIILAVSLISTASVILGDTISMYSSAMNMWKRAVFIGESVMAVSWLMFSLNFARADFWRHISRTTRLIIYLSPLLAIVLFSLAPMESFYQLAATRDGKVMVLGTSGFIFNIILLSYSILAIINLETTLRSSRGDSRWEIKYVALGIGGIIAINIFYYSHALLYRSIHMYLLPVRTAVVLVSTLLISLSLFRHKALDTEFAVSRNIMYKSLSLMIIGAYLLGLGIVGEGMRYLGPKTGQNITIFAGFAGALLVLIVIFSERFRKRVSVYINKHFFTSKYDYREQWLDFTQRISMACSFDELLSSISEGFKYAMGVKGVSLWLKDRNSREFSSTGDTEGSKPELPPPAALLEFLESSQWILDANSTSCREIVELSRNFLAATEASLIVPLLHYDELIGFIVLKDGLAGNSYNYEDYDLLKTLAKQTTLALMNARLTEELTDAREMEAVGRLSSFILHDLKNATSMLSLVVQNAAEHIGNPDFQKDTIQTVYHSAEKIKSIISKLQNMPAAVSLTLEPGNLASVVRSTMEQMHINGNRKVSCTIGEPVPAAYDHEEISKVLVNLILNAIDATDAQGKVDVTVGRDKGMAFIRVQDNGQGMTGNFITSRLFRPFQTTKKKGLGIGLYQCKAIVEAHSGYLHVSSREGAGSTFTVYLPLVR